VDLQRRLDARLVLTQERHEILGPMLLFAPRQHSAGRDIERSAEMSVPFRR